MTPALRQADFESIVGQACAHAQVFAHALDLGAYRASVGAHDLGAAMSEDEQKTLQPPDNPFGPRLL
jgi:hypothetical protein